MQKSYTIQRIAVSKPPIDAGRGCTRHLCDARNSRAFEAILFKCFQRGGNEPCRCLAASLLLWLDESLGHKEKFRFERQI